MRINIKFPKIKKKFKKNDQVIRPGFYWKIILYVSFAIVVFSFIFGFYLFKYVNKETVLSAEEMESKIRILDEGRVDKTLEYFKTRAEKSSGIISTPAPIVDPSI